MLADIRGTEIYYESHGEGEPIAFLNGVMMTAQSWAQQTAFFSRRYCCLLHDMRGQLMSGKPDEPYTMEGHADDFAALLDHLGISSCHVVGTSYGGEVGLLFAARHPERARTLSVVASVSRVDPLLSLQVQAWADAAQLGPEMLFKAVASQTYSSRFLAASPEIIDLGLRRVRAFPPEFFPAFVRLIESFQQLDLTDQLPTIACPTLVVCAEQDQVKTVASGRAIALAIPDSELVLVPDAGHGVVIEAAATVNTIVLGFITKHEERR